MKGACNNPEEFTSILVLNMELVGLERRVSVHSLAPSDYLASKIPKP